MKKRGFTLIELLAVIVVLAIIALIATPIVMNTIKRLKKEAIEITVQNYIMAVDIAVSNSEINRTYILDGSYNIGSDGNLIDTELPNGKLEIDISGDRPTGGIIVIKDKQVTTDSKIIVGEYGVSYDEASKKYTAVELHKYVNGEAVYFNVTTGTKCSSSDYKESQSNTGINSGCMKFYAFNDDGGSNVNLLLDHNTTATVEWNTSGSNNSGPIDVLEQLKTDTSSWQGTKTPSNYMMDQTTNTNHAIDYSEYRARLMTAQEIAKITGIQSWNENSSYYYFDTNTMTASSTCTEGNTSGCQYGWLYDRTNTSCTIYGCLNNSDISTSGYWTISPLSATASKAWTVYLDGRLTRGSSDLGFHFGVRPVIEVLRFNLS